ncbi:MAG: hypothetical protein DCE90_05960 [Pseudanabaena sp.]|nr:MAG: hypothetical protein DCE90_05960 [Pseudanabaena sp.]
MSNIEVNSRNNHFALSSDKKSVTYFLWGFCGLLAVLGLTTPNPFETFIGCLIWPILFWALWRPGEPPVLLFASFFQAVQVFTPVVVANFAGETIDQTTRYQLDMSTAFYLAALSIVVLALGMKIGSGSASPQYLKNLDKNSQELNPSKLAIAYVIFLVISTFLESIAFAYPAFTQLLLGISSFRWLIIFSIAWAGFRYPKFYLLSIFTNLLEIVIGFTGFFGEFRVVLFLLLVVYGATSTKVRKLLKPQALILISLLLALAVYWQGVKSDYRSFVNLGTQTQEVNVSLEDRLSFHIDSISKFGTEDIEGGLESGLDRLGYIRFFAGSIKTVPSVIPYQDGRLWSEAFANLAPRLLFPDKPVIEDSRRTNIFSGIRVAGAAQGTSVSIGYVGESYIDFGVPIMYAPVFALGFFWGWIYRFLANTGSIPLLGQAAATALILNVAVYFESSNLKILAGGVISLLIYSVFLRFGGKIVWKWITSKRSNLNQKNQLDVQ